MANHRGPVHTSVDAIDALTFAAELVLLVCASRAGMALAGPAWAIVGAIAGVAVVGVIWWVWMAPKSTRRLPPRARAVVAFLLAAAVAVAVWPVGVMWVGLAAVSGVVIVAQALRRT